MNTSFTLSLSKLDEIFLNTIKTVLLKKEKLSSISGIDDFELNKPETNKNYINRLLKAKENLKNGKGIPFNVTELNKLYVDTIL